MTEKWAVVLGASSGSGAAIAKAVCEDPGLNIFAVHRGNYPEGAEALREHAQARGRQCVMHIADAGTFEGAKAGVQALRALAGEGSVKLLVHSIACGSVGHFLNDRGDSFHPKQFEKTFNAMAHSFVYWSQNLYHERMLSERALLLGLTNPLHESLLHNTGLIAAAKAALQSYVRQLAVELGPKGHRVNLLKFGTVVTPALQQVLDDKAMAHLLQAHEKMNPIGRICTVEEVGAGVSLLLSDQALWFNGATVDFTGGMTLRLLDLVLNPQ